SYPFASFPFADCERGSTSPEWIQYEFARSRGHLDDTIKYFCRKSISSAIFGFELPMSYRGNIRPHVLQSDTIRIHCISVAAIILNFSRAMTTDLNWSPNAAKRLGLALCIVKETVVAWMESSRNGKTRRDFNGDPMAEIQSQFCQIRAKKNVPLWQVIKKKSA